MKTRCPGCETVFRVTPAQLKARAGKVRCGQCQSVFDALDSLLDESNGVESDRVAPSLMAETPIQSPVLAALPAVEIDILLDSDESGNPVEQISEESAPPLSEAAAQELGKATGLILPRETADIPGYSKWSEGVIAAPFSLPEEKPTRWPFVLVALLLAMVLAGQVVFHFRSEIAVTVPMLRPALEALCQSLKVDLPLPRHVELVSIETSDLQADPAHGNLLVLNASLRNRANYEQAYPSLELSLTDTADGAIARRVLRPAEYLPQKLLEGKVFAANSDVAVRLWIEAKDISAAGYRLYVFYP
jgi:predicted Zn finger-like uncharacterized protein